MLKESYPRNLNLIQQKIRFFYKIILIKMLRFYNLKVDTMKTNIIYVQSSQIYGDKIFL